MTIDPTVILTGVGTVVAIVATNITLMGWLRSDMQSGMASLESRLNTKIDSLEKRLDSRFLEFETKIDADRRAFETKIDADRRAFETKMDSWKTDISDEMTDFHGRLCAQEEKIRHVKSSTDKPT